MFAVYGKNAYSLHQCKESLTWNKFCFQTKSCLYENITNSVYLIDYVQLKGMKLKLKQELSTIIYLITRIYG